MNLNSKEMIKGGSSDVFVMLVATEANRRAHKHKTNPDGSEVAETPINVERAIEKVKQTQNIFLCLTFKKGQLFNISRGIDLRGP